MAIRLLFIAIARLDSTGVVMDFASHYFYQSPWPLTRMWWRANALLLMLSKLPG